MISIINCSAQPGCDTILWSSTKKLAPADFRGMADTGKIMIAFTMIKSGYKVLPQDGSVIINTLTYFFPCSSWLNRVNIKSIEHEQLHFDIAEYHKRLFLKRVSETISSADMFATTTRAIFRDVAEQRRAMNMEYDQQTTYGQNVQEQDKWNIKIANLLIELEKYTGNTTTINLK
ncbi:MAG: hypothetical protein JWO92_1763 [Chitinophagaceae bacterium]|nr:hypothetical protein [Chitinophagaceae bacterium]